MKVVCISPWCVGGLDDFSNRLPVCGRVYTVRGTKVDLVSGARGFLLHEIKNELRPTAPAGQLSERAFNIKLFRPLSPEQEVQRGELVQL